MKTKWAILGMLIACLLGTAGENKRVGVREKGGSPQLRTMAKGDLQAGFQKVVPHLSVNNDWKSVLTFRNDLEEPIEIRLDLIDAAGFPLQSTIYDSDDIEYAGIEVFCFTLFGYEIYSLDFDQLAGGARSLQVFALSSDDRYGVEAIYHNFNGPNKVASVGVGIQPAGDLFVMNLDQRIDPYTLNQKFRGLAITNNESQTCQCDVNLFNDLGESGDEFGPFPTVSIIIDPFGKWVGTTFDVYPDIDDLLFKGLGYFEVLCDRPVSVLGLAFETNTPIVASVPVDYFTLAKNKNGKSVRVKRP